MQAMTELERRHRELLSRRLVDEIVHEESELLREQSERQATGTTRVCWRCGRVGRASTFTLSTTPGGESMAECPGCKGGVR